MWQRRTTGALAGTTSVSWWSMMAPPVQHLARERLSTSAPGRGAVQLGLVAAQWAPRYAYRRRWRGAGRDCLKVGDALWGLG